MRVWSIRFFLKFNLKNAKIKKLIRFGSKISMDQFLFAVVVSSKLFLDLIWKYYKTNFMCKNIFNVVINIKKFKYRKKMI